MLPSLDKFGPMIDGQMSYDDSATTADWIALLSRELRAFLSAVEGLARDSDGRYLCRDPRAGRLTGLTEQWNKIALAAQVVNIRLSEIHDFHARDPGVAIAIGGRKPGAGSVGVAISSLIFMFAKGETESAIEPDQVDRLRSFLHVLESEAMSQEIDKLRIQAERLTEIVARPGVRERISAEVIPAIQQLCRNAERTERAWRDAHPPPAEFVAWMKDPNAPTSVTGLSSGERYPSEDDPRFCNAAWIGHQRALGNHDLADHAEWYFLVLLHDSCSAGMAYPLFPDLRELDDGNGSGQVAFGAFVRKQTGIERPDFIPPRFDAVTVARMIDRLEAHLSRDSHSDHNPRTPLTPRGLAVLRILYQVPEGLALTGAEIVAALKKQDPPIRISESVLTTRVVPSLRAWGVLNERSVGYFVPFESRHPLPVEPAR
ncbi:MAG: hypothetical protein KIT19_13570 [Phycisphaeraceae bacterium]|nr:hypothetical protein [Phycisphaeraceae bacterium]